MSKESDSMSVNVSKQFHFEGKAEADQKGPGLEIVRVDQFSSVNVVKN